MADGAQEPLAVEQRSERIAQGPHDVPVGDGIDTLGFKIRREGIAEFEYGIRLVFSGPFVNAVGGHGEHALGEVGCGDGIAEIGQQERQVAGTRAEIEHIGGFIGQCPGEDSGPDGLVGLEAVVALLMGIVGAGAVVPIPLICDWTLFTAVVIAVLGCEVELVQNDQGGDAQAAHEWEDFVLVADVEVVGRPIEQQMLTLLGQSPGDEHALAPARQAGEGSLTQVCFPDAVGCFGGQGFGSGQVAQGVFDGCGIAGVVRRVPGMRCLGTRVGQPPDMRLLGHILGRQCGGADLMLGISLPGVRANR